MQVVIPDDYQDAVRRLDCFSKLAGHDISIYNDTVKDLDALAERFQNAEALVLIRERTPVRDALLARLPRLKLISQTGKGTAHIDVGACTRRGVTVTAGTGSPYAPAELTWALVLAAMRHIPKETARLRSGHWQSTIGIGLHGRTLGIWGYGRIGNLVAGYGRAFGMNVIVWGREGSLSRARADGYSTANSKETLLEQSDVLSLHIKLSAETRGILTAADLARMKTGALLVNTSRAELIETGALEAALREGRPGSAAVDVYEEEPVFGAEHPLLTMDNAVCTPHLGYVEKDCYELYFGQAFDQVVAFAAGEPINVVKP
ncbi:MAG TPA: D-2-hydroxyacid dehydrogenase family protein [Thermoanaerobaculia bacterium]|nr:D-2-hydroxyacid dehydrogenase family protein [Thermoanaerobaculia bacterium]